MHVTAYNSCSFTIWCFNRDIFKHKLKENKDFIRKNKYWDKETVDRLISEKNSVLDKVLRDSSDFCHIKKYKAAA